MFALHLSGLLEWFHVSVWAPCPCLSLVWLHLPPWHLSPSLSLSNLPSPPCFTLATSTCTVPTTTPLTPPPIPLLLWISSPMDTVEFISLHKLFCLFLHKIHHKMCLISNLYPFSIIDPTSSFLHCLVFCYTKVQIITRLMVVTSYKASQNVLDQQIVAIRSLFYLFPLLPLFPTV